MSCDPTFPYVHMFPYMSLCSVKFYKTIVFLFIYFTKDRMGQDPLKKHFFFLIFGCAGSIVVACRIFKFRCSMRDLVP